MLNLQGYRITLLGAALCRDPESAIGELEQIDELKAPIARLRQHEDCASGVICEVDPDARRMDNISQKFERYIETQRMSLIEIKARQNAEHLLALYRQNLLFN